MTQCVFTVAVGSLVLKVYVCAVSSTNPEHVFAKMLHLFLILQTFRIQADDVSES